MLWNWENVTPRPILPYCWWRKPFHNPVEVGSLSHYLRPSFFTSPGGTSDSSIDSITNVGCWASLRDEGWGATATVKKSFLNSRYFWIPFPLSWRMYVRETAKKYMFKLKKNIFQPSMFRGYDSFHWGNTCISHRIHGTGILCIFTYIYHKKKQPNVGKFTIHRSYGIYTTHLASLPFKSP